MFSTIDTKIKQKQVTGKRKDKINKFKTDGKMSISRKGRAR